MNYVALKRRAVVIAGQSPSSSDVHELGDGDLPFLQGNAEFGLSNPDPRHACNTAPKRAATSDVLLSVRAPVGALNIADRTYGIGRGLCAIRPGGQIDQRFLWWCLNASVERLQSQATGSTYTAVTADDVGSLPLPDLPLVEQRAIADYLDAETARIDALIAKKQQLIHLLEERMDALVDLHFSPADAESTVRLARLAYVQTGVTLNAAKALTSATVRLPYLRVANVQPGRLDLSEVKEVDVDAASAARSEVQIGDVLMTEGGDIDKLGRGTVWRGEIARCLHQNHVFAVRPDPKVLDSEYLANVTRTSCARAYFESTGVQSTNLASTNASKVADFRVPLLPVSVQRQKCIAFEWAADPLLRAEDGLRAQVLLLAEHRQSVITAATALGTTPVRP